MVGKNLIFCETSPYLKKCSKKSHIAPDVNKEKIDVCVVSWLVQVRQITRLALKQSFKPSDTFIFLKVPKVSLEGR